MIPLGALIGTAMTMLVSACIICRNLRPTYSKRWKAAPANWLHPQIISDQVQTDKAKPSQTRMSRGHVNRSETAAAQASQGKTAGSK